MAFIKLNGVTIPIIRGGDHRPNIQGDVSGMNIVGAPMQDRRNIRREWEFTTSAVGDIEGEGIVGLVEGRGQHMPYATDLNTSKGRTPDGTPSATIISGRDSQDFPALVYRRDNGELEALFGSNAVELADSSTNLFSADQADAENAPTGYLAFAGATLGSDTSIYLHGGSSLEITTSTTNGSGAEVRYTGAVASKTYSGSCYVYTTEALPLRILLNENGSSNLDSLVYTSVPNVWQKVQVNGTTSAGATSVRIYVQHNSTTSGKLIYCDQFQLEEQASATPWIDVRTSPTRGAPSLTYKGISDLSDDLTFAAWVRPSLASSSGAKQLVRIVNTGVSEGLDLRRGSGVNDLQLLVTSDGIPQVSVSATAPWDDSWHHVALVLSAASNGTANQVFLYIDGTLEASGTLTSYPKFRGNTDICSIGCNEAGTLPWEGPIQDVMVLPFALSSAQVVGLASRTRSLASYPALDAEGDFFPYLTNGIRDENNPVKGEVTGVEYDGLRVTNGVWNNAMRRVSFKLTSVNEKG